MDSEDTISIAKHTLLLHQKKDGGVEYAKYAQYSAAILAREIIALSEKLGELVDELHNLKQMFLEDNGD